MGLFSPGRASAATSRPMRTHRSRASHSTAAATGPAPPAPPAPMPAGPAAAGLGLHLLVVADHPRHFRHRCERARINLRRAARDEDRRAGVLLRRPPDRLARAAHRFARHRAGIDDHRLAEASLQRMSAHHLGLIGVEAASEGNHRRARRRGGIRHLGVFNVPRAAANQGVVSMSRCASSEAPSSRIRSTADSRQVSMYPVGALPSGR